MEDKLKKIHIPQLSGFWKGLLSCIGVSILLQLYGHSAFASWHEVLTALSNAGLDTVKVAIGWILFKSPFAHNVSQYDPNAGVSDKSN